MFNNPEGYNVLPYKHNYTKNGEYVYTGFFIPAFTFVAKEGCIDNRGVTNIEKAKEYYIDKRNKLISNPKEYRIECAEFCFTPEDALSLEGDNLFNAEALSEQLAQIVIYKNAPKIETGVLEYQFKNNKHTEDNIEKVIFRPNSSGHVRILEHPIKDKEGNIPKNLYVAGIDGIDLGQEDTSDATVDPSKFCVTVLRRAYGLQEPTIVCVYKDRPKTLKEAHKTALQILQYYDCKAVLESTRVSLLGFFRERKVENKYLMRRPRMTQTDIYKGNSRQFGAPATETVIKHQLELISNYIDEFSHNIWFPEVLDELLRYSYANKTKFDIVASLGMTFLGDEELMDTVLLDPEKTITKIPNIGFWTDSNGIKHRGVVPDKNLYNDIKIGEFYNDDQRIRNSNPRYNL